MAAAALAPDADKPEKETIKEEVPVKEEKEQQGRQKGTPVHGARIAATCFFSFSRFWFCGDKRYYARSRSPVNDLDVWFL